MSPKVAYDRHTHTHTHTRQSCKLSFLFTGTLQGKEEGSPQETEALIDRLIILVAVCVYACVCVCVCVHVSLSISGRKCMCMCMYVYLSVCVCVPTDLDSSIRKRQPLIQTLLLATRLLQLPVNTASALQLSIERTLINHRVIYNCFALERSTLHNLFKHLEV